MLTGHRIEEHYGVAFIPPEEVDLHRAALGHVDDPDDAGNSRGLRPEDVVAVRRLDFSPRPRAISGRDFGSAPRRVVKLRGVPARRLGLATAPRGVALDD